MESDPSTGTELAFGTSFPQVSVRPQISLRPLLEQAVDVSRNPPSLPPTLDGLVSSWAGPASKKRLEIPRRKTRRSCEQERKAGHRGQEKWRLAGSPCRRFVQ
ncbi:unnamed protein product [Musa textilis]